MRRSAARPARFAIWHALAPIQLCEQSVKVSACGDKRSAIKRSCSVNHPLPTATLMWRVRNSSVCQPNSSSAPMTNLDIPCQHFRFIFGWATLIRRGVPATGDTRGCKWRDGVTWNGEGWQTWAWFSVWHDCIFRHICACWTGGLAFHWNWPGNTWVLMETETGWLYRSCYEWGTSRPVKFSGTADAKQGGRV